MMQPLCSGVPARPDLLIQRWGASVDKVRDRSLLQCGACLQRCANSCCIRLQW